MGRDLKISFYFSANVVLCLAKIALFLYLGKVVIFFGKSSTTKVMLCINIWDTFSLQNRKMNDRAQRFRREVSCVPPFKLVKTIDEICLECTITLPYLKIPKNV